MNLPVAILAGGRATRLGPLAAQTPKSLVDVGGKPFAVHQIELLRRNGLIDIVFLVGHMGQLIRDRLGDGRRWDARLQYVFDGDRALGTGGAIHAALDTLGDAFFVLYGDSYLECEYGRIGRAFIDGGRSGLMTVCRNDDRWDRSNVRFENGRILRYDKHSPADDMRHIDYGLGAFRRSAFHGRAGNEAFDLSSVYQQLLAKDDLQGFEVAGRFYEVGSLAGLNETRRHLEPKETT